VGSLVSPVAFVGIACLAAIGCCAIWWAVGSEARRRHATAGATGIDEVFTVLCFTAPAAPAATQAAVDQYLDLPHEVPTVTRAMHVSESRPDCLRIALGCRVGTEWSGVATFQADNAGGTTGTYRVTSWSSPDRDLPTNSLTEGMGLVRERLVAAIAAQGGRSQLRSVPVTDRS
jgi:hypothetical protein